MKTLQSLCCKAPVTVAGNTTKWYVCTACAEPCDLVPPDPDARFREWVEGFVREENDTKDKEILRLRNMLAEAVCIARRGRYPGVDFVSVGRRLDAMEDHLCGQSASQEPLTPGTQQPS